MAPPLPDLLRRAAAIGGLAATGLIGYAYLVEPRWLQVERWTVRIPHLPPVWEGLRIVHLTDFQMGMWLQGQSVIRRAIDTAVSLQPDLIFLTGDFVHQGRWNGDDGLYRPLARTAPTFAVLGNHDHYDSEMSTATIVRALQGQGIEVLVNGHAWFRFRGESWAIVGVDDLATGHSDLLSAITGIPRNTRLLALLTHVPDVAGYAPEGWFPLIVAGHTHGAQVHVPSLKRLSWLKVSDVPGRTRYLRGWYEAAGGLLYVNRGLGLSNLPLRFGARPEVALFVLTGGSALPDGVRWQRRSTRMRVVPSRYESHELSADVAVSRCMREEPCDSDDD
jgi:predicted MPP superfamily phosphohydrolase